MSGKTKKILIITISVILVFAAFITIPMAANAWDFANDKYEEFYDYEDDYEDEDEAFDAAEDYWREHHK